MNERNIHLFFEISLVLKGLHALIECVGGVALYFISTAQIAHWVALLTQNELTEDPRDAVANFLLAGARHLSIGTESLYAWYLVSHGIVNLLLVVGLLMGLLWAYPASLVALSGFILYQLYRFSFTHSLGLIALTGF